MEKHLTKAQKKSLKLLDKYFLETPKEKIKKDLKEISDLGFEGPFIKL